MSHWTEGNVKDFLYRIASDFIDQLQNRMDEVTMSQAELATKLGVTEGRVSQILNKPSNLKLEKIIEYSRALGMKVAIVAYDDGDADNLNGPVNSEIFSLCWEKANKPQTFLELHTAASTYFYVGSPYTHRHAELRYNASTDFVDRKQEGTPNDLDFNLAGCLVQSKVSAN